MYGTRVAYVPAQSESRFNAPVPPTPDFTSRLVTPQRQLFSLLGFWFSLQD